MKRTLLLTLVLSLFTLTAQAQNAWINELHYDNDGVDTGEFLELVIQDVGNYSLSDFTVELYDDDGGQDGNVSLSNFVSSSTDGAFTIYEVQAGLENEAEGLALCYQNSTLIQFISYEGQITASGGCADGAMSTDIGVSETNSTPIGESLQLEGTGSMYADFSWTGPAAESPGAVNANQTLTSTTVLAVPSDYGSIQAAIDAATAGDVIEVAAGTYNENIIVDKELELRGPNAGTPGNDASRTDEATIEGFVALSASNATLDGFDVSPLDAVDNQAEAILVNNGADNVIVRNNIVRDFSENFGSGIGPFEEDVEGIVAFGGKVENGVADPVENVTIERNFIQNIDGRDAEGGAVGISIQGYVDGATVRENEISNVGMGASAFALGVAIRSTGNPGIEDDPENVSITDNTIHDVLPLSTSGLDGVGLEFEPSKESNQITVENNTFTNTTLQVEDKTVTLDVNGILANNTFDRAVVILDANGDVKDESGVQKIYSPIASAVANASSGEMVDVYAGTYAGDLNIDKALTVRGASTGGGTSSSVVRTAKSTSTVSCTAGAVIDATGSSIGIDVVASNVTLANLCVKNAQDYGIYTNAAISDLALDGIEALNNGQQGLEIAQDAEVTTLTIDGSTFSGNTKGMNISGTVIGLEISGSAFDGNDYGFYTTRGGNITQELADGGSTSVSNVTVTNTSFNHNPFKGIYAEKLDNATFEGIEVIDSGTDAGFSFAPQAIDINLKLKSDGYGSITVRDATVTGSIGEGLNVKARDDGNYAGDDATSLSNLTVENSTFEGNRWGIVVGNNVQNASITDNLVQNNGTDPGSYQQSQLDNRGGILFYANPSTADFAVETNCITGNQTYGLFGGGAATVAAFGNYWGDVSGPSGDFLGRGDPAFGDLTVDFSPEPVAACSGGSTVPAGCEVTTLSEIIDNPDNGPGVITATFSNPDGILDVDFVDPDDNDNPVLENLVASIQSGGLVNQPDNDGIEWAFTGSAGNEPTEVIFTLTQKDENVTESRYFARVTSVCEEDGLVVNFDPVHTLKVTPAQFAVGGNYPNPFRSQTTVQLDLPETSDVTVSVYDVMGRKVATLVDRAMTAGMHNVTWQGQDRSGRPLASGVYFMRVEAGDRVAMQRLTIVR